MDPRTYFDGGFNCAESVLLALSECAGFAHACIPRVATGFGGGMRCGSVCGAVSGAVMAFGIKYGRMTAQETEKRDRVNKLTQELITRFQKEHKTVICLNLLGVDVGTEEGKKKYEEANLHQQCRDYVITAYRIALSLLAAE